MAKRKRPASPLLKQPHYGFWQGTAEGAKLAAETADKPQGSPKDGG